MIGAAILFALAMGPWVPEVIPDVRIGPPRPIGGTPVVNWRHTDLNADGRADLVFAERAVLQRDGRFPLEGRIDLPEHTGALALDVWDGAVYMRLLDRIVVYRWNGATWDVAFSQDIGWPDVDAAYESSVGLRRQGPPQFESFLIDLDGDNYPEIVVSDRHGVYCFRREGDSFLLAGNWPVFPPLELTMNRMQAIWPPGARRLMMPIRQMNCTVLIEHDGISVVHRDSRRGHGIQFTRQSYALEPADDGTVAASAGAVLRSEFVPDHVKPFRLNSDAIMDFAGGRWELSQTSAIPTPVFETWASVDGGAHFTVKRVACLQSFRPHCSFVDFDSDGQIDLVTEGVDWSGSGPRETLNQISTAQSLPHVIRVYRQSSGIFSDAPDYTAMVQVELGAPVLRGGPRLLQYQAGELVNITGDLNGDGLKDLCIRTGDQTIQVVPTGRSADGFSPLWNESATIPDVPAGAKMRIADVDQNGCADLVLQALSPGGSTDEDLTRVLFSPAGGGTP